MEYQGLIRAEIEKLLTEKLTAETGFRELDEKFLGWVRTALSLDTIPTWPEVDYIAPLLMLHVCGAVGGEPERWLRLAAGVQTLHQTSVLFDDLQDQDQPNSLATRSEALSLALYLLNLGQEVFFEEVAEPHLLVGLFQTISRGCRGQLLDKQELELPLQIRFSSPEFYIQKISLKTAETGSFLARLGATLGGASPETIEVYARFGLNFSLSLHLLDDLADYLREDEQGRDLPNRFLTLVYIEAYRLLESPKQKRVLELWEQRSEDNNELRDLLTSDQAVLQTLTLATRYLAQAEIELQSVDPDLKKIEHQALLGKLKSLIQRLYTYFSLRSDNLVSRR